jgi:hypothetical protein
MEKIKDSKNRKIETVLLCDRMTDYQWSKIVTLPPVYAKLPSIILSCQYFVKTVIQSGSCRIIERFRGLTVCVCRIAVNMTSTKPHVMAKSFIWFYPLMSVEKPNGRYNKRMKVMNGVMDRASIEIGRDSTVPLQQFIMVQYVANIA